MYDEFENDENDQKNDIEDDIGFNFWQIFKILHYGSSKLYLCYICFHITMMISFIGILCYNAYVFDSGSITMAMISDLYAGLNYFVLWCCCKYLVQVPSIFEYIIEYEHGPSLSVTIISVIIFVYTLCLDMYYLIFDSKLDFGYFDGNSASIYKLFSWKTTSFAVVNIIAGGLARPSSILLAGCVCEYVIKQLRFLYTQSKRNRNDNNQHNNSYVLSRNNRNLYFNSMSNISFPCSILLTLLHMEIIFEIVFRGLFIYQYKNQETIVEITVQIVNGVLLLLGLLILDLNFARIHDIKDKCIRTYFIDQEDAYTPHILEYLSLPNVFGIEISNRKLLTGLWFIITFCYTLINFAQAHKSVIHS